MENNILSISHKNGKSDILDDHTKDSDTNLDESITLSNLYNKNIYQIL